MQVDRSKAVEQEIPTRRGLLHATPISVGSMNLMSISTEERIFWRSFTLKDPGSRTRKGHKPKTPLDFSGFPYSVLKQDRKDQAMGLLL